MSQEAKKAKKDVGTEWRALESNPDVLGAFVNKVIPTCHTISDWFNKIITICI
jgi:hypothetical protein